MICVFQAFLDRVDLKVFLGPPSVGARYACTQLDLVINTCVFIQHTA